MTNFDYMKNLFDPESGTTVTTDIEPAISIDHTNRLVAGIKTLQKALGITNMIPMAEGSVIKRYKTTYIAAEGTAAEGEIIPLSKVTRVPLEPIYLTLTKDRKLVTAEAIQRSGLNLALNETDEKVADAARKKIKNAFFGTIKSAGGTAKKGANLQAACAQAWGALQVYYEDMDVTPVFFVNPLDVATYLSNAAITTQSAFGFSYVENFLGLGNAFITTGVEEGKVYATATQNLNALYIPVNGAIGNLFSLTSDVSGLVGMVHTPAADRLSIETVIAHGVTFYAEDESGIFVSVIGNSEDEDTLGELTITAALNESVSGTYNITSVSPAKTAEQGYFVKNGSTRAGVEYGEDVTGWEGWNGSSSANLSEQQDAASGQYVEVVVSDENGKAIAYGYTTLA